MGKIKQSLIISSAIKNSPLIFHNLKYPKPQFNAIKKIDLIPEYEYNDQTLHFNKLDPPISEFYGCDIKKSNRSNAPIRRRKIIKNLVLFKPTNNWRYGSVIKYTLHDEDNNSNNHNKNKKHNEIDTKILQRKANLGTIIQVLQLNVPNLLTDLLPHEIVSQDIILKILPNKFPNIPIFKGYLMYSSSLKTIQKLLLLFYLNPESKLHITNIKVFEPTNSMSSDELINFSIDNIPIQNERDGDNENLSLSSNQEVSKYTTKVKVKWRTCLPGCTHIENDKTTNAKWGSYSLDHFDWTKILKSNNPLQSLALLEAKKKLEGLAKTLQPLTTGIRDTEEVDRVLTGVFIFELDAANENIIVMTIDNVEILESKEMNYSSGFLAT